MKDCCNCKESKSEGEFCQDKKRKDGLNPECRSCVQKRNRKNSLKYSLVRKKYAENNATELAIKRKLYFQSHKSEKSEYDKQYRENNSEKIAAYKKKWERDKLASDIKFKITRNLRRRLSHAIHGNLKSNKTLALLGCKIDFFKEYLESKFLIGMSWENYGLRGWHIDHIKPCSSFDFADPKQQEACFHYTNLQPLWEKENLRKGSKH